jgi:multiple sugar transport system permease protein
MIGATGAPGRVGESPGVRRRLADAAADLRRPETRWAFVFLAPWLVGFAVFTAGPMIASLAMSFMRFDFIAEPRFVGLANYEQLLRDRNIGASLFNSFFYASLHVPLSMIVALGLALLLTRAGGRAAWAFRTLFYLPAMTPPVAVGILFLLFLNPHIGVIGRVLGSFGIESPGFTTDQGWIKPGIVLLSLWSLGSTVIIYFAALRNVPVQLYEAAAIDGASAWRKFRHITLPMISGALFFTLIVNSIASIQIFAEVWTMYFGNQAGGAGERAALFYVIYLFQQAFQFLHMGYASAMAWILFAIILAITAVQVRFSKRWVYYESGNA